MKMAWGEGGEGQPSTKTMGNIDIFSSFILFLYAAST
jgi:hypothetical protein